MAKPERGANNPPPMTTREFAARHGNVVRKSMPDVPGRKHKRTDMPDSQERISAKIAKLRSEGKSAKEAAGMAYGMEREGRLGPKGGYKRKG